MLKHQSVIGVFVLCVVILWCCFCSYATDKVCQEVKINRFVIVLYDSKEEAKSEETIFHKKMEIFLNHLGYIVEYYDVRQGVPSAEQMKRYFAVVSWMQDNELPNATDYINWLIQQIDLGRKVVILGELSIYDDTTGTLVDTDLLKQLFSKFGVEYFDDSTDNPMKIELVYKNPELIEFERKLDYETNYFVHLKPVDPANKNYLILKRNDIPNSESSVVFTCKIGGIVTSTYVVYMYPDSDKMKLRINPFIFFREALFTEEFPIPDVTTRNGARLLFCHIDGDAFISNSQYDTSRICGEVIKDEILKKYHLPTSVSMVVGELISGRKLPWIKDKKDLDAIAHQIYSIPYIEPATHTFTHPLHWEKKVMAVDMPGYSKPITDDMRDMVKGTEFESLEMPMYYITVSYEDMARKEILDSIDYINTKLLPGTSKKCGLVFWSGNCLPFEEAQKLCDKYKLRNLNGGDPVFDEEFNSYTHLCALMRPVMTDGTVHIERQVYTAACNENIYTGLWTGPFYGFRGVIDTFKRAESPIRIKPANIYYHFYSGERTASLEALWEVYDYVVSQEYYPVYASQYVDTVYDWFDTQIFIIKKGIGYRIENNGICRTVRFDNCRLYPDFSKCRGVIGFQQYQHSLYVHLDDSGAYEVWLSNVPPSLPYISKSTADMHYLNLDKKKGSFEIDGVGKCTVILGNLLPDSIYIIAMKKIITDAKTDSYGYLKIDVPDNPIMKHGFRVRFKYKDNQNL